MSNILLTSIGTGRYNQQTREITYSETNYALNENRENVLKSAYMYEAMLEFKNIDKIIFIGTTGSNWHALYEHLFQENSKIKPAIERDEEYAVELLLLTEGQEKDADECRETLQKLVDTMGEKCQDIIILNYGMSKEEMNQNFERLAAAKQYIKDGDTLSFDITHSFRSLAFYELLAVNFFKLSMGGSAKLDFISYGMFEIAKDNDGITPIVNQEPLLKILEWTKAADEFKRFGTTHLLCQMLEENNTLEESGIPRELARNVKLALGRLGEDVATNNLKELRNMVANCRNITEEGSTGNSAIDFIFTEIYERFGKHLDRDDNNITLYVEFAKWHIEKKRYIAAAITMIETMIRLCYNENNENDYEEVRKKLRSTDAREHTGEHEQFIYYYNKLRGLRNKLCHAKIWNRDIDLRDLIECIDGFFILYGREYNNRADTKQDLINTINAFREY